MESPLWSPHNLLTTTELEALKLNMWNGKSSNHSLSFETSIPHWGVEYHSNVCRLLNPCLLEAFERVSLILVVFRVINNGLPTP